MELSLMTVSVSTEYESFTEMITKPLSRSFISLSIISMYDKSPMYGIASDDSFYTACWNTPVYTTF